MTNLETHVTSLALSRELKEAGVNLSSYFSWYDLGEDDVRLLPSDLSQIPSIETKGRKLFIYQAYLASELGEILCPNNNELLDIETYKEVSIFPLSRSKWCCSLMPNNFQPVEYYTEADTEADARAKMLLHLIQSGVVKVK